MPTHENEKPIVFDKLFKQTPKVEQMRNPLYTHWNTELSDENERENQQLLELIDFSQMNNLFENFLAAIGLPVAIIDLKGTVLASSKWQRLCVDFHRANAGTLKRCIDSDVSIYAQLQAGKEYSSHQCANGLIDCASPIVIEDRHLANLFIGQFFIEQPDLEFFKQQQQKFGFDEYDYFAAIAEVPIIDEEKLPAMMALLVGWAKQIADRSLAEKRAIVALSSVEQQVKQRTEELAESHVLLQTAQRAAQMGYFVTDLRAETWVCDAQFDEIFGIDAGFVRNIANWQAIIHPEDVRRVMDYFNQGIHNHEKYPAMEYRITRLSDGEMRWIAAWWHNFYDAENKPLQQVGMVQDITQRKQEEEELLQVNERLSLAQQSTGAGVWDWNLNTQQTLWDEQMFTIYGLAPVFPLPFETWISRVHPDDISIASESLQRVLANKTRDQVEYRIIRTDGKLRYISSAKSVLLNKQGDVIRVIGIDFDITERKISEEYISHLAFYDPLTQLPNRRLLQENLKHGIEVARRMGSQMAVLMMDLDKFKAVNDTLGHAAGDELLKQVAERIKVRLREMDTVARLGGDEFVILIENVTHDEQVAHVAEAIIDTLSQPFILYQTHTVSIGASIGIALHPQHGDSVEALMNNADTALYHAKEQGRGRFAYFSKTLTRKVSEHIVL